LRSGRNDPCSCGSGRKYKHCCGELTAPEAGAASEPALAEGSDALAALIHQRRFGEAEQHSRARLERDPDSGTLWKILGVALAQQGKDALPALRRAAQLLPDDPEAHRNLAAVLVDRGERDEALASLARLLEIEPRDVAALIVAANTLCALGRHRESLPLYHRALEIEPRRLEARNNLGNALQELGEYELAAARYQQALEIAPADPEIHCNLGNALRRLGRLDEAVACAERAITLAPGLSMARNNLGLALAARGRFAEATASFRQALQLDGHFIEARHNLGNVLRDMGEPREALACYREAVALDPQRAESHCYLGNELYEAGQLAESVASFRCALTLRPEYPLALLGLAAALRRQGSATEAQACVRTALALEQESAAALTLLADLHTDRGEFTEAQRLYERALAGNPDFAPALCGIAAQRRMTSADTAWLRGATGLLAKRLPLAHTIDLHYALGKYHNDLGQYDEAFSHYREANELGKRCAAPYEAPKLAQHVDAAVAGFNRTFLRQPHAGASDSELPVFVIGMPRSGTSLTEQILASHAEVFGAGEIEFWGEVLPAFMDLRADGEPAALARMARRYLERLSTRSGAARRVVDKMPANFLYAGLIHTAFPRARIIHMQRDPLDTCLSIYFQNFTAMRPFTSDLESLAHYYGEYLRITDHWRAVLPPETLLEVPYEALIESQEHWTRRMLDFIGLPWDPKCLEFHRTERVVITASRWQVRQKITSGSIGRWRHYEKHLGALLPLVSRAAGVRSGGAAW
jgi:tetratricopeptide (TPR) repeat protein